MRKYIASGIVVLGVFTTGINGQTISAQTQQSSSPEPLTTEKFMCAASGQGSTYLKVCVSKRGNVVSFESPAGVEHIRVGTITEGYNLCGGTEGNTEIEMSNYGSDDGNLWQDAYKVQQPKGKNTFPLTLYSKGNVPVGGQLELVQTFSRDAARRELTINMRIYNRTGQKFGFTQIKRAADFDINNTPSGDVFSVAGSTVIASESDRAVSLTGAPYAGTRVYTYPNFTNGGALCRPMEDFPSATPTAPGDYVAVTSKFWGGPGGFKPNNGFVDAKFVYRVID